MSAEVIAKLRSYSLQICSKQAYFKHDTIGFERIKNCASKKYNQLMFYCMFETVLLIL